MLGWALWSWWVQWGHRVVVVDKAKIESWQEGNCAIEGAMRGQRCGLGLTKDSGSPETPGKEQVEWEGGVFKAGSLTGIPPLTVDVGQGYANRAMAAQDVERDCQTGTWEPGWPKPQLLSQLLCNDTSISTRIYSGSQGVGTVRKEKLVFGCRGIALFIHISTVQVKIQKSIHKELTSTMASPS